MPAIVLKPDTRARLSTTLCECLRHRAVPQYLVENELLCDLLGIEQSDDCRCWRKLQGVMARFVDDFTNIMDYMLVSPEERERRVVDCFMEFAAGCRAGVKAVSPGRMYFEPSGVDANS
jgi:hypothetical protein